MSAAVSRQGRLAGESSSKGKGKAKAKFITHPVQMSDSFMGLSIKYDVTVAEIRKANNLSTFSNLNSLFEVKIPVNISNKALRTKPRAESEAPGCGGASIDGDGAAAAVEAPAKPKSRFDFLNKVDHEMARLKVDSELVKSAQSASVTLSKDQSDPDGLLLCQSLMSTTVGRERAGVQARDKIQSILVGGGRPRDRGVVDDDDKSIRSDIDASPNSSIDLVLDSYCDETSENDLSRDLDVYDL